MKYNIVETTKSPFVLVSGNHEKMTSELVFFTISLANYRGDPNSKYC